MAPRQATAQRRNQSSQNEGQIFELGVRGRKTGVTLVDTGERDEYGMEPVDNLFSSPEKETAKRTNGASNDQSEGESDEEQSMELDDESQLGPATVARMRNPSQGRLSIPRARSPVKTHLNSPARHNTHIAPGSSPARGSVVDDRAESPASKSVKRRLNFANPTLQPPINGNSKAKSSGSQSGRPVNRLPSSDDEEDLPRQAPPKKNQLPVQQEIDDEEEEEEEEEEDEEPMEVLDMGGDNSDLEPPAHDEPEMEDESGQQEDEEEPAEEVSIEEEKPQPKKRGRKPKNKEADSSLVEAPNAAEPAEAPAKKQRGRPKRDSGVKAPEPATKGSKRRVPEEDHQDTSETADAEERGNKKARKEKGKAVKAEMPISKPKAKPGRKRKSSGVGPASPAMIPRAPMPKSRGLQILRREGLGEGNIRTTRSGRISAKPLEFWKGERYEFDTDNEDLVPDKGGRHIKLATIKSVVRVEAGPDEPKVKRRGRPGTGARGRPKRQASAEEDEEDEERSDWEDDPGRMVGECIVWRPEYEQEPPEGEEQVEVIDEEMAISEAAVQMKDIKGATFQFAKTLTLPFFGSGIVDLPPHSEKKPKNARKMQMVFFVHYGSVEVTIAGTQFRIGKGGQFFVPRGNHYSISNTSERPARIFFAQGCEMLVAPEGEEAAE
ncbi:Choline transport protein [Apiospora arundinis]